MFETQEERNELIDNRTRDAERLAKEYSHERRIVCAAIRVGKEIICGARHYDVVMIMQISARSDNLNWRTAEQGFIDNWGLFLDRDEAFEIAKRQGQIINHDIPDRGLFSEHLY